MKALWWLFRKLASLLIPWKRHWLSTFLKLWTYFWMIVDLKTSGNSKELPIFCCLLGPTSSQTFPAPVPHQFLPHQFCPDFGRREKINLNIYLYMSLWCFKRFYEGLWGTTKKCENENLSWFLFYCNYLKCTGWIKVYGNLWKTSNEAY